MFGGISTGDRNNLSVECRNNCSVGDGNNCRMEDNHGGCGSNCSIGRGIIVMQEVGIVIAEDGGIISTIRKQGWS